MANKGRPGSIVGGVLQSAMSCCDLTNSKTGPSQKVVCAQNWKPETAVGTLDCSMILSPQGKGHFPMRSFAKLSRVKIAQNFFGPLIVRLLSCMISIVLQPRIEKKYKGIKRNRWSILWTAFLPRQEGQVRGVIHSRYPKGPEGIICGVSLISCSLSLQLEHCFNGAFLKRQNGRKV